jgi:hypothetical protein
MVRASLAFLFAVTGSVLAYDVLVSDDDYSRQSCSGMYANDYTYINGRTFRFLTLAVANTFYSQLFIFFSRASGKADDKQVISHS